MQRKNKWTAISFSIKILRKSKCQVSLVVKYTLQNVSEQCISVLVCLHLDTIIPIYDIPKYGIMIHGVLT